MNIMKSLKEGIITNNPIFIQLIGMCPTLGVTTNGENGLAMGLATAGVLVCSNLVISLIRKIVPDEIRIPVFIVVIATFVTAVGMLLEAFLPDLNKSLGLFIPLIVVNCLILGRAEAFASKNSPGAAAIDGLSMGLGFTLALTILGSIREILGAGELFGMAIMPASFQPSLMFILPPGAFFVLGLLIAIINKVGNRKAKQNTESIN